jgi:hypothetical protein
LQNLVDRGGLQHDEESTKHLDPKQLHLVLHKAQNYHQLFGNYKKLHKKKFQNFLKIFQFLTLHAGTLSIRSLCICCPNSRVVSYSINDHISISLHPQLKTTIIGLNDIIMIYAISLIEHGMNVIKIA